MESPVIAKIKARFPNDVLSASAAHGDDTVVLKKGAILPVLRFCKEDPELDFTFLMDLGAVDYLNYPKQQPGRFAVAYHLFSLSKKHRVRLKVYVNLDDPVLDSAVGLWKAADWAEREVWDQFGISFNGHPNLKRILNHKDFVGHPLRKDYHIRKRQPFTVSDTLMDEMLERLQAKGLR